jgi:hypothetical protein
MDRWIMVICASFSFLPTSAFVSLSAKRVMTGRGGQSLFANDIISSTISWLRDAREAVASFSAIRVEFSLRTAAAATASS